MFIMKGKGLQTRWRSIFQEAPSSFNGLQEAVAAGSDEEAGKAGLELGSARGKDRRSGYTASVIGTCVFVYVTLCYVMLCYVIFYYVLYCSCIVTVIVIVLYCIVLHCIALPCIALPCIVMHRSAMQCNVNVT